MTIICPKAVKLLLLFDDKPLAGGAVFICSEDEEICAEGERQTRNTAAILQPLARQGSTFFPPFNIYAKLFTLFYWPRADHIDTFYLFFFFSP